MTRLAGGVTAATGFSACGVSCGIKRRGRDLALIFSDRPAAAAGTLTQNSLRAPCVDWAHKLLKKGTAQAILANSGNANCCTGRRGIRDTEGMAALAGKRLGIPTTRVFVASTGIIGRFLPMDRVKDGIGKAAQQLNRTGSRTAAEAMMTTDTRPKEMAVRFKIGSRFVTVGGIAKGSGMVFPRMATMLAFLTTDAKVEPAALRSALFSAVADSFNAITIDGETSTNDMVLILANGASGSALIRKGTSSYSSFLNAVREVARHLAHEIVRDGEGVTRLMTVKVVGASTRERAVQVARQIANSALVKTMVAGRDPNWGRVAAAVGASGVPVVPERLTIRLGNVVVFRRGEPTRPDHETVLEQVDQPEVHIGVDLGAGRAQAKLLSGDLTEGYVRINAKYTT